MNKVVTIFLFFYCSILFGQNNINSYKYILVPKQFEFQKSEDQYQLNSLSKFLFDKAGYKVLFTDEQYPNDLASNSCLGLKMVVNNSSSIFKTKMNIELYDCYNKIVFSTNEGTSRKKEYKKAYHEAIRSAFKDLEGIDYKYSGVTINKAVSKEKNEKNIESKVKIDKVEKKVVAKDKMVLNEKKILQSEETIIKSIEGKYKFDNWGESVVSKSGDDFIVVGGDEIFEFAKIYKTSKQGIYIIKWVTYKQPQLLEIDLEGNLKIDTKEGYKLIKRIN